MCSSPKSPTMEVNEQSQPKLKASMTSQNVGTLKNQKQKEEEQQEAFSIVAKNGNRQDDYLDSLPPGYRFCPYDHELVVHYLKNKVLNKPVPHNKIREVNLYDYNPEDLTAKYEVLGEKEWYFFTPRDRKYRNGSRPSRTAGTGYWKATGADKDVKFQGVTVGFRKALVFYKGKPPKGDKTNWIMHEYRVDEPPKRKRGANDMRLDDCVLCRIYKKAETIDRNKPQEDDDELDVHSNTLSDEGSPVVMNDNDKNCDSNHNIGDSSALINTNSDYLQPPFQIRVPEIPHFDASLANATNSLLQPSFNYEARPISFRPPVYSAESIFRSKYLKEDGWNSEPRGLQGDIWGSTNLDNYDLSSMFDFSNTGAYMDPFLNLDNILPSNVPDYPPMPRSG